LAGHTGPVHTAAFSPNYSKVVTSSADGTARIWDVATGQPLSVLSGDRGPILTAAFDPKATGKGKVITASADGTARIWAAARLESEEALPAGGIVNDAEFAPGGDRVVTASRGGHVRIWNVAKRKEPIRTLRAGVKSVNAAAFSSDGKQVVTASQNGDA